MCIRDSFSTLYPMDSIASPISLGEIREGSKLTFALPSSRLTATESTPSFLFNIFSIFRAQAEQVIPETPRVISFGPVFGLEMRVASFSAILHASVREQV